jgi:DeoR family transcriptional regulator of aga operon
LDYLLLLKEASVFESENPVALRAALRHDTIRRAIEINGRVSIADLKDQLGVSEVTLREDLKYLEGRKVLTRVRGGAIASRNGAMELSVEETSTTNRREKMAIGAYAASMVKNGQTIIIDVGSTTTELAKALSPELVRVVVITNGLNIALLLESLPGISVIVTGGTLRPLQHSLVAPMGTLLLDQLKADVAFLGCNGVDPVRGFTNTNIAEAEIKQAMVNAAAKTVFLADHDKIGQVASAFVTDISGADLLITDNGADVSVLSNLKADGLAVETVSPGFEA